jgi:hypothetical protein
VWGSGDIVQLFLTLALGGGVWSVSRPGRFIPAEKPQYPLARRLGGPHDLSGRYGEGEKSLVLNRNRTQPSSRYFFMLIIISIFIMRPVRAETCRAEVHCNIGHHLLLFLLQMVLSRVGGSVRDL